MLGNFQELAREHTIEALDMHVRAVDMTDDELATIVSRAKLTLVKSDN